MLKQIEQQITPLFEFLGIPLIILTPLLFILFLLFRYILPKMLNNNATFIGRLVANIVAQLFGEGTGMVKGVESLDVVQVIKSIPELTKESEERTNEKLNDVCELVSLLSEAMMSERLIKPQSSRILQEIIKKSREIRGLDENNNPIQVENIVNEEIGTVIEKV